MQVLKITLKTGKEFEYEFKEDDKLVNVASIFTELHNKYLTIKDFIIPVSSIDYIEMIEK